MFHTHPEIKAITDLNEAGILLVENACFSPKWGPEVSDPLLLVARLVMKALASRRSLRM